MDVAMFNAINDCGAREMEKEAYAQDLSTRELQKLTWDLLENDAKKFKKLSVEQKKNYIRQCLWNYDDFKESFQFSLKKFTNEMIQKFMVIEYSDDDYDSVEEPEEFKCTVKDIYEIITKFAEINSIHCEPYLVDIDTHTIDPSFLAANIMIINITSKNYEAFKLLVKQIEKSPIRHVLFISSTSVYKNTQSWVTESSQSELPESKLFQIEQLFSANNTFNSTILRLSGLIGYQRHPGRFFKQGKLVTSPDAPVNLIHRDDCIAIIKAIIRKCAWGEVFNACADNHPSKKQFYSHARSLLGEEAPSFSDSGESHYKIVSNDKIKQQLNYQFIYPDLMQIPF